MPMQHGQKSVHITTGGSGGHVMPALAFAQHLQDQGHDVTMTFDERTRHYSTDTIPHRVLPIQRPHFKSPRFWLSLAVSFFKALCYLRRQRPTWVISFGGYTCLPVILAGWLLRIPLSFHEQNAVLGRANRALGFFARHIFLSYENTEGIPAKLHPKTIHVGLPVRKAFYDMAISGIQESAQPYTLMVLGGSQGAQFFSHMMPKAVEHLPADVRQELVIWHQCPRGHENEILERYRALEIKSVEVKSFFHDMPERLSRAAVIFTRCGASTLAELEVLGKKAALFPLLTSAQDHQRKNALETVKAGGGWLYEESLCTPQDMAKHVKERLSKKDGIMIKTIHGKPPQESMAGHLGLFSLN